MKKQFIQLIKRYPRLYDLLRHRIYAQLRSARRYQIFTDIYKKNYWDDVSTSGPGSSLEATADIRRNLPSLLNQLRVKSLLDIPCGDLYWMQHVQLNLDRYIGADIVAELIEQNRMRFGAKGTFLRIDLLSDGLPPVDAIFCRDCLVHISFREIFRALDNIVSTSAHYVLMTTFPNHQTNMDTIAPYWRALNLERPPFNLPPPIHLLKDYSEEQKNDQGKYLGVWVMGDLRATVKQKARSFRTAK